jgi:hypothetical protein
MVSQPEKDRAPLKLCTLTRVNIEHSILRQEKKTFTITNDAHIIYGASVALRKQRHDHSFFQKKMTIQD